MARQTIEQTKAELYRLGDKLGIPREAVTDAITKCGDDNEVRALRRKWRSRAVGLDNQFARKLRVEQEDRWAAEALVTHGETMVQATRDRHRDRRRLTLGSRLDQAMAGLGALSTVGAPRPSSGGGRSSERPAGPPPAVAVDVSAERTALTVLVELIEDRWDAERGLLAPVDYAKMPVADKNRLLARLEGVHSREVAELFPFLGSQRTVENYRREWGCIPSTGLPKTITEEVAA